MRVHASNHPSLTLPVKGRGPEPSWWAMLLAAISVFNPAFAAPVTSFDDIEFWTGAGPSRASIAIDWNSSSSTDAALVWGYRWDGEARGEDMLRAVLAADARLFAKLSAPGPLGISVWGIGYDANNDGQFALSDGTEFDADGVAVTGLPDEDASAIDPADWYREGWFTGVWSYGTADENPWPASDWNQSPIGPSNRVLADGAWDSWAFASPIVLDAFAQNPMAAEAPSSDAGADFDSDGDVDGADLLTWQRGLGIAAGALPAHGDANGDFAVDALDLEIWRSGFAAATAAGPAAADNVAIPEPPMTVHAAFVVLVFYRCRFTRRKIS